jgi:uncharacterized protein (DUF3084 family)
MISGYILVTVVLFLGGIIAVSGDRIGSKVGKARLTLFKLRPRQTATLVTITAGTLLSASVLTVLFASSEQLRTGIFDLQRLQNKLNSTSAELAQAISQKNNFRRDLEKLRIEQSEAKEAFSGINQSLKDELTKRTTTAQKLKNLQQQIESVGTQKTNLEKEVDEANRQIKDLTTQQTVLKKQKDNLNRETDRARAKLNKLIQEGINLDSIETNPSNPNIREDIDQQQTKATDLKKQLKTNVETQQKIETQRRSTEQRLEVRKAQLQEKTRQFTQIDQELAAVITEQRLLDRQLNQLETQLKDRERKMTFIDQEVARLEREYQSFNQGSIVVLRNQVMAMDVVSVSNERTAEQIIQQLLKQANQSALAATPENPNKERQVVKMSANQEQQIINQLKDGKQHVVRLFAVSNYLASDNAIELYADAALNQKVFKKGEVLTLSPADPTKMNDRQLRQQVDMLLNACQLRARRGGIVGDGIKLGADGDVGGMLLFVEQIKTYDKPIDIRAITVEDIYTAGPIAIKLQALQDGKVVFE